MKPLGRFNGGIIDLHRECCKGKVLKQLGKMAGSAQFSCPRKQRFIKRIQCFIDDEDGLVAPPEMLQDFVGEIEANYYHLSDPILPMYRDVNEWMKVRVFDYDGFRDASYKKHRGWGGGLLMEKMFEYLRYCPYCNAETVYALEKDEKTGRIKSAFDHFFPRGRYPFLSLSLYNLIPSCYRCNSQFKRDEYKKLLSTPHPYIDDLDGLAQFLPMDLSGIWASNLCCPDLKIQLLSHDLAHRTQVRNYEQLFGIDRVYQTLFNAEAVDSFRKAIAFNDSYLDQVKSRFEEAGIFNVDVKKLIFNIPSSHEQIDKCRLSKLNFDLYELVNGTDQCQSLLTH